ncbi:hypothetical protein TNCV_1400941 [Trichonephila clavipes]|nr:hypothetical protein TNCV_1400941 [Trichonephila clavipes]
MLLGLLISKRILRWCLQNESKRGRKRNTTSRTDRFLVRNSTMHPYKTSRDLQRKLLGTGVSVDSSTVRRRLIEAERFPRKSIKKTVINTCNKETNVWIGPRNTSPG